MKPHSLVVQWIELFIVVACSYAMVRVFSFPSKESANGLSAKCLKGQMSVNQGSTE